MEYKEIIEYLYSRLPMFSRLGSSAIKKDLTNTLEFCKRLGNPEKKFKTIHIGGTNGKGSTSHMLAAILQTAGYKTGLYTSPHLKDFRERIRINGKMIGEEEVIDFVNSQKHHIEDIEPSFFEVTVAMAFDHFAKHKVDIAIIEVGLGGRLDSTNVILPVLSIITNISFDHVSLLGNTLAEIAFEKAGIIKSNVPLIIGERQSATESVFLKKAEDVQSEIVFASDYWEVTSLPTHDMTSLPIIASNRTVKKEYDLQLDLTGTYQLKNIKPVLSAVEKLNNSGFTITDQDFKAALKNVKKLTGLMGRWQILNHNPLVICDTGHNEDGIKEVLKNIRNTPHQYLHMVFGVVKDKDVTKILDLLPADASYYFCSPAIERAKPAEELMEEAIKIGLKGQCYPSVSAALNAATNAASKNDLVFVGGSTFVVAEVIS